MNEVSKIQYVELTESNFHFVIPLFKASYNRSISLDKLKKKYHFPGFHTKYLGVYLFNNEEAIGFTGLIPCPVAYKGESAWAAQFVDTMIIPSWRGKNLFADMLHKLKDLAAKNGFVFCFVFANQRSAHPTLHKANWILVKRMIGFEIKNRSMVLPKLARIFRNNSYYLRWTKFLLKQLIVPYTKDAFSQSNESLHLVHDQRFIEHKQSPNHFIINISNVIYWIRIGAKFLEVGFVQDTNEAFLLESTAILVKISKLLLLEGVLFEVTEESSLAICLMKKYNHFESWPVLYTDIRSEFPIDTFQLQYADVDSFW